MGSIPICGNVFLQPIADSLHPQAMEAGQQNMNEKDNGLFSGDGKDSSSRCETTEGSDGPGWNTPGRRETPQHENADQGPGEPSRLLTVGHLMWLHALAYAPPWH